MMRVEYGECRFSWDDLDSQHTWHHECGLRRGHDGPHLCNYCEAEVERAGHDKGTDQVANHVRARHLTHYAVREEMRDQQYRESAEFKARIDLLQKFLLLAIPSLPVPMPDVEERLWVRRMVGSIAREAEEAEAMAWFVRDSMTRGIGLATWSPAKEEEQ